uniref:3'(2'),5'-bisphosphate nucleotidase 1 n=1 Tax=Arion vulgaris TaxID=1028688 RepID=A0A0B7AE85_9EUPU
MATPSTAVPPLVMRILAASVSVSHKAGSIIRDILKTGNLGIVEKGKNDLQTEADRAAQRSIVATLHKQFPKVAIFGEESLDPIEKIPDDYIVKELDQDVLAHACPDLYKEVTSDQVVIWVDPLDGTAEFTEGLLDHVTVLIGVAINGEAKGGVIYQPYYNYQEGAEARLGRCIWGLIGLGSFGFTQMSPPANKNVITTTRSHADWIVTEAVNSCEPTDIIKVGGAGHKVLLLIEGKVHAYVFASKGCKKWDTCAPEAVLHAIGGHLTDLMGKPILYHEKVPRKNAGGVLATLQNHQWYVDKIPQNIKSNFSSDSPSEAMVRLRQQAKVAACSVPCGDSSNKEGSSVDPPVW